MGRGRYKFFEPDIITEWYTPPAAPINPELYEDNYYKNVYSFDPMMAVETAAPETGMTEAEFDQKYKVDEASKLQTYSSDIYLTSADHFVGVNTTAQAITVTLPEAMSVRSGKQLVIKDEGGMAATNNITVVTQDGAMIDNHTEVKLMSNCAALNLYYNGSGWHIY
jgi:hypothetical protein